MCSNQYTVNSDTICDFRSIRPAVGVDSQAASLDGIAVLRRIFPWHQELACRVLDRLDTTDGASVPVTGAAYLLCITPRSGSSMLSDILGRTRSVGAAAEHFTPSAENPVAAWMPNASGLNGMFAMLAERAPSGYFGIKGDLFQMFPLISAGVFSGPGCIFRHILLLRRDRVGQAISLARAVRTNEWHSHDLPVPDPALTFEDVLYYYNYLRAMEADWERVFTVLQLDPLRLYYEDLLYDRAAVFEKIGRHLNVEWKTDPCDVVSAYESVSARHDARWAHALREEMEAHLVLQEDDSFSCDMGIKRPTVRTTAIATVRLTPEVAVP